MPSAVRPGTPYRPSPSPSLCPPSRAAGDAPAPGPWSIELLESRVLFTVVIPIEGVESGALDQPRVNVLVRDGTGQALGGDGGGVDDGADVQAFLDTGTSSNLLSRETAEGLGLSPATQGGQPIVYSDIGVGGSDDFHESDPISFSIAPFRSLFEESIDPGDYSQNVGPFRTEIAEDYADETIGEPLDIVGMPALAGKTMVIDARPLNDPDNLDSLRTYVYDSGTPYNPADLDANPGVVPTNLHVKLSYGDFGPFTTTSPDGAPSVTVADNPFIGTSPVAPSGGGAPVQAPGITVAAGGGSATGSFLFDTGAAASFMSQAMATRVGVHYAPGTYGTDNVQLLDASNQPVPDQFQLPIGGVGGTVTAAGFYLDSLTLPTTEGVSLQFVHAPILVLDVSVENPTTGADTTLDGDFGMNYLVASLDVSDLGLGGGSAGAFDWITFDQPSGLLGLQLSDPSVPPAVEGVKVNNGAAQRSMVTSLTVTFNEPVTAGAGAFALTRRDGSALNATLTASNPSGDGVTWLLTFSGASVKNGSLADGVYDLRVVSSAVHSVASPDTALIDAPSFAFHRLYGDADGDGDTDALDLFQFRNTLNKHPTDAGYLSYLDYDGNGSVDAVDLFQVRSRLAVQYKGY